MKTLFVRSGILIQLLAAATCASAQESSRTANAYLGQAPPGKIPVVFARGLVSTGDLEHSAPAFSPDGNEVFWCVARRNEDGMAPKVIMTMRREGSVWSRPAVAPFSGEFSDCGPAFSADGRKLYFDSGRPSPNGTKGDGPWFIEKQEDRWSKPKCLCLVARFPELRAVLSPTIAREGALYFMAYAGNPAPYDFGIYRAELVDGEYAKPQLLPRSINLPSFLNWTPYISPDESYLLFSSDRRSPETDDGDLYISRRQSDGGWNGPVSLGEPVNSEQQERFPMLSPDGQYLFFTRPTPGHHHDVYWVRADAVEELRSKTERLNDGKGKSSFQGLGHFPGGAFETKAQRVSADGSVVVGYGTTASGNQAFRWSESQGMVSLGNLPDGSFKQSWAVGISADGSVVVGYGDPDGSGWNGQKGFRWTQSGGMAEMGSLDGSTIHEAFGLSADGSVVVGNGGQQAFRWTQSSGMVGLGVLPGRANSRAVAVSADGSVVTGSSANLPSWTKEEAYVWTQAGGMQGLGILPGGVGSFPNAISPEGSVIAGTAFTASGSSAFRWAQNTGMVRLRR